MQTIYIKIAAKTMGISESKLRKDLVNNGIFTKEKTGQRRTPYQKYIKAGYFQVHQFDYRHPQTGKSVPYWRTDFTQKGLDWFWQKFYPESWYRHQLAQQAMREPPTYEQELWRLAIFGKAW